MNLYGTKNFGIFAFGQVSHSLTGLHWFSFGVVVKVRKNLIAEKISGVAVVAGDDHSVAVIGGDDHGCFRFWGNNMAIYNDKNTRFPLMKFYCISSYSEHCTQYSNLNSIPTSLDQRDFGVIPITVSGIASLKRL